MTELYMELFKMLRKPRTYIGPAAMLLLIGAERRLKPVYSTIPACCCPAAARAVRR